MQWYKLIDKHFFIVPLILLMALSLWQCKQNDNKGNTTCCDNVIFVDGYVDTNLVFNNVLTPNGDGYNDSLYIIKHPTSTVIFQVLDANKTPVFVDSSYQNNWKGTDMSGQMLADGKYTYKASNKAGTVTAFVCIVSAQDGISAVDCLYRDKNDPLLKP